GQPDCAHNTARLSRTACTTRWTSAVWPVASAASIARNEARSESRRSDARSRVDNVQKRLGSTPDTSPERAAEKWEPLRSATWHQRGSAERRVVPAEVNSSVSCRKSNSGSSAGLSADNSLLSSWPRSLCRPELSNRSACGLQ